ncbi:MAG: peptidoglycan-binding protein [Myxococcales bacterium]|nr:peptidoglycan-binding protein [Myxococcales bacterium]
MRPYVIRQGDYITKLGHTLGFDALTVWNDPKNAGLRERRPDPDMLHPGDLLWIPDAPDHRRLSVKAGATNRYAAHIPKKAIDLKIQIGGEALPKEPYMILGLGPEPVEGETDERGHLVTKVDVSVREIEVILTRKERTLRLRIGDLDPVDTLAGLRKRLLHLGYYQPTKVGIENEDATDGDALVSALKSFQAHEKLTVSGKLDEDTRKALQGAHGS